MNIRSVHSRRALPTQRPAIAFARGALGTDVAAEAAAAEGSEEIAADEAFPK